MTGLYEDFDDLNLNFNQSVITIHNYTFTCLKQNKFVSENS